MTESVVETGDAFLRGGGEMGALMRTIDWSATLLGPAEHWPQSLKTAVSICINSRFPIVLWWGPDLIKLYNDAYRYILSDKHPRSMGAPGRDIWPEIWHIIGPMLQSVVERGEATWSDDQLLAIQRRDLLEERYFTFSYSPIAEGTGRIGGVFCAVTETTERVLGARRLATLRTLAEQTMTEAATAEGACRAAIEVLSLNAADVPFALLYLLDDGGARLRLAGSTHASLSGAAAPATIDIDAPTAGWPWRDGVRHGRVVVVDDVPDRVGAIPSGVWPEAVRTAVMLPVTQPGQQRPYGLLVAGTSPRRLLDDAYRGFFDLVAGQVASAIANARAHEAERRRAEALAELDRTKTQFFSNVSHEFRTPLTLMLGPLQEALANPRTRVENRERLEMVNRNAHRLLRLVNALLDFSRVTAGRVQASYEATDLAAYTADVASSFRAAIEAAGIRFTVDAPSLREPVYVDRDMWDKVVLNLVSNAFKHTFDGEIVVRIRGGDGVVRLDVSDTGVGIPHDELPRIFERFHRVPNARSRTHEGTGIGLALVQELVKLHGGTLTVESRVGVGSIFTASLPSGTAHLPADRIGSARVEAPTHGEATAFVEEALRWLPERSPDQQSSPTDDAGAEPAAPGGGSVLIADDNADMRAYLSRLFSEQGWAVRMAGDGHTALDMARRRAPDVIVSDVMMPGLDGFELLRELRNDPRTRGIPFMILSARAGEEARIDSVAAGADDYVVKPFAARELVARVAAQLQRAHAAAEKRRRDETQRRLLAAVEGERARLRELFSHAPSAIAVLRGPSHIFELANPHYLALVGGRDIVGKPIRDALPELVAQGIIDILDEVFETGAPFIGNEFPLMVDTRGDGTLRECFFNFVYQPMRDTDGSVSGIYVHAVNVTELVRARQEAEAAGAIAATANRAKSEFLAAMSHELRTPLNAIGGHAQLLEMGVHGPLTDPQRDAIRRIERSEQHLLSLINDVLNFAKLEAGRVEYDVDTLPLAELVRGVMDMVETQLNAKQLRCELRIAPDLTVRADEEKVRQIMLNLVSNAIKFTAAGGAITIDSAARPEAPRGMVFLRVSDTGIGVPREKQAAIFDPFVQLHPALGSPREGTGLGLAISRDLARGMGGDIRIRSEEGRGSVFTVSLPLA